MYQRQVFNRYLTDSEESQLFGTIAKFGSPLARRDYAWMKLCRETGLRVSPLSRLIVQDAKQALRAKHLVVRGETNKAGKTYEIFLNTTARQMLHRLLRLRREQGFAEIPEDPLIVSRNHRAMSVRSFQARMKHWCEQAQLTLKASPHWLRHTYAKRIIERSSSQNPLCMVQHALGHSDINSTAVYTFPDREEYEAAIEAAR